MVREQANSDALMALGEALVRPDGLIGAWAPLVCHVCSCLELPAPTRSAAVLTLCKLMATSGAFCEEQLPLLFTLMGREPEQAVRATIAVALGDLVVRHPNRLEPWTDRLYSQLRDSDVRVRKNMLMVLTHLILNDMVKVKGRVSEMARCLLDEDPRVAAHARLFFSEFAKKGSSPVYNLLPDIMSSLSSDESLGSAPFREARPCRDPAETLPRCSRGWAARPSRASGSLRKQRRGGTRSERVARDRCR